MLRTIGEVSELSETSGRTIKGWIRRGLLTPASPSEEQSWVRFSAHDTLTAMVLGYLTRWRVSDAEKRAALQRMDCAQVLRVVSGASELTVDVPALASRV